jgi:hypothetical protein
MPLVVVDLAGEVLVVAVLGHRRPHLDRVVPDHRAGPGGIRRARSFRDFRGEECMSRKGPVSEDGAQSEPTFGVRDERRGRGGARTATRLGPWR